MPAISDQDMAAMLAEESRLHDNDFCVQGALYELYQFASKYHTEVSCSA
jgi:plexin A